MNDFARNHSGDDVFKRIMFGAVLCGASFAVYMMLY
jgi:hypothetical protein